MWTGIRRLLAILTSIAVIALIYQNAVPRTQRWHSVLPGAAVATGVWFVTTLLFGWYLNRYGEYSLIYGSLGVGIALLIWMHLVSWSVPSLLLCRFRGPLHDQRRWKFRNGAPQHD